MSSQDVLDGRYTGGKRPLARCMVPMAAFPALISTFSSSTFAESPACFGAA
jgi:hypothetical protein